MGLLNFLDIESRFAILANLFAKTVLVLWAVAF